MYSFAKILADHIFLQNRDKKIKKSAGWCAAMGRMPLIL
jgi:hypothetical protein